VRRKVPPYRLEEREREKRAERERTSCMVVVSRYGERAM
jgi:hypothetical protein